MYPLLSERTEPCFIYYMFIKIQHKHDERQFHWKWPKEILSTKRIPCLPTKQTFILKFKWTKMTWHDVVIPSTLFYQLNTLNTMLEILSGSRFFSATGLSCKICTVVKIIMTLSCILKIALCLKCKHSQRIFVLFIYLFIY